jgi:hypothetical protein
MFQQDRETMMIRILISGLLCIASAGCLAAQTANINSTVTQLEQSISTAMSSGDLRKARDLSMDLVTTLTQEIAKTALTNEQKLAQLEAKYAGATGTVRFRLSTRLPRAAFDAGQFDKAAQYADELLQSAPQYQSDLAYGDAYFEANTIRGRISVRNNDLATAKQSLLASMEHPGSSPTLINLGPYMGLAQDLLTRGERDSVIQFLSACKPVWTKDGGALDLWIAAIRGGGTPTLTSRLNK